MSRLRSCAHSAEHSRHFIPDEAQRSLDSQVERFPYNPPGWADFALSEISLNTSGWEDFFSISPYLC